MSDVPYAREIIKGIRKMPDVPRRAKFWLGRALQQLWREPPCRKAPSKPVRITAAIRARVRWLAANTKMTMLEIAHVTGVRSQGRISEILNGKKKKKHRITP